MEARPERSIFERGKEAVAGLVERLPRPRMLLRSSTLLALALGVSSIGDASAADDPNCRPAGTADMFSISQVLVSDSVPLPPEPGRRVAIKWFNDVIMPPDYCRVSGYYLRVDDPTTPGTDWLIDNIPPTRGTYGEDSGSAGVNLSRPGNYHTWVDTVNKYGGVSRSRGRDFNVR